MTSGTIRAHWHPSVRRAIAMVVTFAVLVQSAACSYVPTRPDERACAQDKAEVLASAKDLEKDQQAIFFNVTVDGRWTCAAAVPKDKYFARLFVTWSDGTAEEYGDFPISVEPGGQYSVLAYEVGVGHAPATATLIARQGPETAVTPTPSTSPPSTSIDPGLGKAAVAPLLPILLPVVVATMIVVAPFTIASKYSKSKQALSKNARLAMNCWYVWIEDAKTHETIAGVAPSAK